MPCKVRIGFKGAKNRGGNILPPCFIMKNQGDRAGFRIQKLHQIGGVCADADTFLQTIIFHFVFNVYFTVTTQVFAQLIYDVKLLNCFRIIMNILHIHTYIIKIYKA